MKTKHVLITAAACLAAFSLDSCIITQTVGLLFRDSYPGERPPKVIPDNNGKPANENWIQIDEDVLPASSLQADFSKASDGLPYGTTTEYSRIIISPYEPHYNLDTTGVKGGSKVWDPYTRKPFYVPYTFTIN